MRVLVTAASRHGATSDIAGAIADGLRSADVQVDVRSPQEVTSVEAYDGVVIGSAIYAGHWLAPAREFVERHHEVLATLPVWLFSSGPIGDPPKPAEEPVDVARLLEQTLAQEHRVFPGRIDPSLLGIGERLVTTIIRVAPGDYRPWPEVSAWASTIAASLPSMHSVADG